jgi:hypothetical protein
MIGGPTKKPVNPTLLTAANAAEGAIEGLLAARM